MTAITGGLGPAEYSWYIGPVTALSGLTLTNGTLAATGGGTVSKVVAGTGLSGGTITTSGTINSNWNGGTVTALGTGLSINSGSLTPAVAAVGNGLALNSGTVSMRNVATVTGTASATSTIGPASGTSDVIFKLPAAGGSVTLAAAPAFARQEVLLDIVQGATVSTLTLNSGYVYGTSGGPTGFVATATAAAIDRLKLMSPDGTKWAVMAVNQGFTV